MSGTLTFNKTAAMNHIVGKMANGLDAMLSDMEGIAVEAAPVGKKAREAGASKRKTRQSAVEAVHTNFIPDRVRYEKTIVGINSAGKFQTVQVKHDKPPVSSRKKYAQGQAQFGQGSTEAARFAVSSRGGGSFTFDFRRKKDGRAVSGVAVGRRGLVEARPPSGNLRSKIHRSAIEIDGVIARGNLRSEAPYSAPVEFGFRGAGRKGSSSHEAQPFMRKAKEAVKANWRSYFKG